MTAALTHAAHGALAVLAAHLVWESTAAFITYWKETHR